MFLTLSNFTGLKLHELAPDPSEDEGSDDAMIDSDPDQACSSGRSSRPLQKKQRLNSECSVNMGM